MNTLTHEEKANIINIIGLKFIKVDDKVEVTLTDDSTIITPYTYADLAMMLIARLNNVDTKTKCRLRKILKSKQPSRLKLIHILDVGKYFKYH